jgi:hemerythrin-like domain-containing protein
LAADLPVLTLTAHKNRCRSQRFDGERRVLSPAFLPPAAPSFMTLLGAHSHLIQLFLSHQEALLMMDIQLASRRLRQFHSEIQAHIQAEEQLLLPVYARAGRIRGGPPEFFTGEHAKMLTYIERFVSKLEELNSNAVGLRRELIELFDDHAAFKSLMEHHDQRERNIFYPTLDRITGDDERRELLKRFSEIVSEA